MLRERIYKGVPASQGISIGHAYLYTRRQVNVSTQHIRAEDTEKDIDGIKNAIDISLKELNKIFTISIERVGEKNSKIFEAQIEILKDNIFLDGVIKRVREELRSAGYVFSDEIDKLGSVFLKAKNDYLKERYTDIMDVKNRVLRNMRREKLVSKVEENAIIFAHELSPADTILFSRRRVQGYATDTGGVTSHAAIISRALRVPAVVGMKIISRIINTGDFVIIDGFDGMVILNPNEKTVFEYKQKQDEFRNHENLLYEIIDLPCETLDGKKLEITSNIEFIEEVDFVYNCGHCGIGLYRTEHLFMDKGSFPSQAEQIEEY
ncbi:phosphoenolpyruvate--protein phosphotransferase, partial [bacterium]